MQNIFIVNREMNLSLITDRFFFCNFKGCFFAATLENEELVDEMHLCASVPPQHAQKQHETIIIIGTISQKHHMSLENFLVKPRNNLIIVIPKKITTPVSTELVYITQQQSTEVSIDTIHFGRAG